MILNLLTVERVNREKSTSIWFCCASVFCIFVYIHLIKHVAEPVRCLNSAFVLLPTILSFTHYFLDASISGLFCFTLVWFGFVASSVLLYTHCDSPIIALLRFRFLLNSLNKVFSLDFLRSHPQKCVPRTTWSHFRQTFTTEMHVFILSSNFSISFFGCVQLLLVLK